MEFDNTTYRDLIPRMTADEYEALKQSMEDHMKVFEPIEVWNGRIVDGCTRYEIAKELGLTFETKELDFPDDDAAMRYRIEKNLVRRHLNTFQRIELAERCRDLFKSIAKQQQGTRNDLNTKKIRESSGTDCDDETASNTDRDSSQKDSESEKREKRRTARKNETGYKLAKLAGTNERTYRQAVEILKKGTQQMINAVRNGDISVNKAYNILKSTLSDKAGIIRELDRYRADVFKAASQIQEAYEWILAQNFEYDGEDVTAKVCKIFEDSVENLQYLVEGFDQFDICSSTGIISIIGLEDDGESEASASAGDLSGQSDKVIEIGWLEKKRIV